MDDKNKDCGWLSMVLSATFEDIHLNADMFSEN